MPEEIKEHLREPLQATRAGSDLTEIAERLIEELPEQCKECGLAESLGCTLVAGEWWLPQTPRAAKLYIDTGNGGYLFPSYAEFALRHVVQSANGTTTPGPKGDGTVCCIDTRDIQSANYTD